MRLCVSAPITIMCTVPSFETFDEADLRRTPLSWGAATLLSSHAGGPRSATGDTANHGQTNWPTATKRVSPPPPESQTDQPDSTDPPQPLTERQGGKRNLELGWPRSREACAQAPFAAPARAAAPSATGPCSGSRRRA